MAIKRKVQKPTIPKINVQEITIVLDARYGAAILLIPTYLMQCTFVQRKHLKFCKIKDCFLPSKELSLEPEFGVLQVARR